nr:MAG TPA: xyloglucan endo-transglycosylase [Microviridae sp.]
MIISTLCRRSRRAARINLLFLKENYIFLYWMIYDMCADRF